MERNKFTENDVRWRVFRRAVRQARAAFADVSPEELQKMIDEAVAEVRAQSRNLLS